MELVNFISPHRIHGLLMYDSSTTQYFFFGYRCDICKEVYLVPENVDSIGALITAMQHKCYPEKIFAEVMTDHEREVVKQTLSYASQEIRAAQRCVEVLANLFEDMRKELYPHQASRIWYILNQIPNLERVPMYPHPGGEKAWPQSDQRFRWHFMEHTMPTFHIRQLADFADELSEMLSGVKIEDVAQSKGYESYLAYMTKQTTIGPLTVKADGWRDLDAVGTDSCKATTETIKPIKSKT